MSSYFYKEQPIAVLEACQHINEAELKINPDNEDAAKRLKLVSKELERKRSKQKLIDSPTLTES